jgi:uncharacterized protein
MITDLWFYLLAVPALLLTSISKGGFGAGLGVLAVPLMALRLPVPQVTAIMLPIICVMDVVSVWVYRGRWDRTILAITLPGALVGIGLGTVSFGILPDAWLRLAIGAIAIAFTLRRWFAGSRPKPAEGGRHPVKGALWAAVSGFTSFLANAGGPPFSIYLLSLRLEKTLLVGTTAVFFAVVNFSKVVPFLALGLFTHASIMTSLALAPIAVVGTGLGFWLHRRIDAALFYQSSYVLVLILGIKFVYGSLAAIL